MEYNIIIKLDFYNKKKKTKNQVYILAKNVLF